MQYALKHRFSDVLSSLSKIFAVQPSSNYEELVSRSSRELNLKAWAKTAEQMSVAMKAFERLDPQTIEAAQHFAKLSQEQAQEYEKLRDLAKQASEFERASRQFERQIQRLRDSKCSVEYSQKHGAREYEGTPEV